MAAADREDALRMRVADLEEICRQLGSAADAAAAMPPSPASEASAGAPEAGSPLQVLITNEGVSSALFTLSCRVDPLDQ